MDRRRFLLTSLAGIVGAPLGAGAQQGTMPRVGWLSLFSGSDPQVRRSVDFFRQALRDLGHAEGQSVAIEYRWAEGKSERLLDLATELVRLKVAVIVAQGGVPPAQAAQCATKAIPIVLSGPADPVAAGLVARLARPGGNITGPTLLSEQLMGKGLELLREVVPKVTRVTVLWNPTNPGNTQQLRGAEAAAAASGATIDANGSRHSRQGTACPRYTRITCSRRPEASCPMPGAVLTCTGKWPFTSTKSSKALNLLTCPSSSPINSS